MRYEGYGPGGVAVIVEVLTDNKNRTAGEVRATFTKAGGNLAETGAVSFMFDHVGVVEFDAKVANADAMLEAAIEAGAEDVVSGENGHEVYTTATISAIATATTAYCSNTPITPRSTATGWPAAHSTISPAAATKVRTKSGAWCPRQEPRPACAAGRKNASSSTTPTITSSADNWFERCGIGVHFTAGSEGNEIAGNAFVGNRNQVKYVGTRDLDWSKGGRGNYWSDNPAFDLNGDGIADTAYRPNDLVDRVLWTAPPRQGLINSPAVQVLRWAQAQFPALYPGGVVDSHPLIAPPPKPSAQPEPAMTVTVAVERRGEELRRGQGAARRLVRPRPGRLQSRWSATTAPARPR